MADAKTQITDMELRKMLAESILSDETKEKFAAVLEDMNEEEKFQLIQIIEEGNKAKDDYEKERIEKLARINAALEKHLADVTREEEKYAREEFEKLEKEEDGNAMAELENQLNDL